MQNLNVTILAPIIHPESPDLAIATRAAGRR